MPSRRQPPTLPLAQRISTRLHYQAQAGRRCVVQVGGREVKRRVGVGIIQK